MFLATANGPKQLLHLNYIGHVTPEDLRRGAEDIQALLADLKPGFRVLADFERLDSMDIACMTEIGRVMEKMDRGGVGLLVRLIPDPTKDIGLDILTLFHYRRQPRVVTCKSMAEAFKKLSL